MSVEFPGSALLKLAPRQSNFRCSELLPTGITSLTPTRAERGARICDSEVDMANVSARQPTTAGGAGSRSAAGGADGSRSGNRPKKSATRDTPNGQRSLERLELALRSAAEGDFSVRLPARRRDAL